MFRRKAHPMPKRHRRTDRQLRADLAAQISGQTDPNMVVAPNGMRFCFVDSHLPECWAFVSVFNEGYAFIEPTDTGYDDADDDARFMAKMIYKGQFSTIGGYETLHGAAAEIERHLLAIPA
jgi:hypothetical protein